MCLCHPYYVVCQHTVMLTVLYVNSRKLPFVITEFFWFGKSVSFCCHIRYASGLLHSDPANRILVEGFPGKVQKGKSCL